MRLILTNHTAFRGTFAYDEFLLQDVVLRPIQAKQFGLRVAGRCNDDPGGWLRADHLDACRLILESKRGKGSPGFGLTVSDRNLEAAVRAVCQQNRMHPVRDYLAGLTWDGKKRMERLWIKACHTA